MNEQMNASLPPTSGGPSSFFQIWMNALTKPNEQTFADMANSGNANATTALLWVFISSLAYFFFASLVQGIAMRRLLEQFGGGGGFGGGGFGSRLIGVICGAPILAVIFTLIFAVGVAIYQWVAKMFGGRGAFNQMIYAASAITAPIMLINIVFALLGAIPLVGLCFGIVSFLVSLYALVLHITAIKGVNQFGWGPAIGSAFLPGIVLGCCVALGVIGMMTVLGPKISETFNQINNNLVP